MANRTHLEILNQGKAAWNDWRRANSRGRRRIDPDLSGEELKGKDLRDYDLSRANLWQVQLQDADLRKAKLNFAQMRPRAFRRS